MLKLISKSIISVLGTMALISCASQSTPTSNYQFALQAVTDAEPELIAFRHDLHRHPELAGNERRTASKISEKLNALGYEVRTGVGGYGVVAILEGKYPGSTVAFRADMDAVAGDALDPVPYASVIDNVHHTCGHDIHTTIGIGIAEGFAAIQENLSGSVILIFQPAEEAGTGAEAMLAEALFEDQTPESIFAVHTAPFDVGQLAVMPDGMLAGRTAIEISLTGDGDLEAAATAMRNTLMGISDVSYETMLIFQTEPFIFVDLAPQGPAKNQQVKVSGYVMSAGISDRVRVESAMNAAVTSMAFDGIDISLRTNQALEGVNNDPQLVATSSAAIIEQAPELQVLLGVNNPEAGTIGFPHSPDFIADDGAILTGTKAMLAAMLEELT